MLVHPTKKTCGSASSGSKNRNDNANSETDRIPPPAQDHRQIKQCEGRIQGQMFQGAHRFILILIWILCSTRGGGDQDRAWKKNKQ